MLFFVAIFGCLSIHRGDPPPSLFVFLPLASRLFEPFSTISSHQITWKHPFLLFWTPKLVLLFWISKLQKREKRIALTFEFSQQFFVVAILPSVVGDIIMSTLPLLFFSQQFFVIAYCLEHYCNIVQHYCNIVERHWRYYEHIAVIVSQLFSSVVLSRQYYLLFIKYSPRSYHKYIFPLFPIISISPLSYHKYFSSFLS